MKINMRNRESKRSNATMQKIKDLLKKKVKKKKQKRKRKMNAAPPPKKKEKVNKM